MYFKLYYKGVVIYLKRKNMQYSKKFLSLVGVGLLLGSTSLVAEEKTAISIIKNVYAYTGSMDKYTFDTIITNENVEGDKVVNKSRHEVKVKVDRPGNLRIDITGDAKDRTNYAHNGKYTVIDRDFGYYAELDTPKTIDGTLDYIVKDYGMTPVLSALIYSDMEKRIRAKSGKYFGSMDVAGVECDYIAFNAKPKEVVHVWITTGDKPLIKAYSVIKTNPTGHSRMNASLIWDTDAKISESDFVFSVPKDVMKISIESAN
jgi:hypothetical protein